MTYGHLRLTACTPGSAPGPTLGIEYGKPLPLVLAHLFITLASVGLATGRASVENMSFDIRPHRRRTWTGQSYSPGGANMHTHLIHASLLQAESTSQTASRLVQPFLHSSQRSTNTLKWAAPSPSKLSLCMGDLHRHLIHGSLRPLSPQPKQHLDRFSCLAGLTTVTDQLTDHASPFITMGCVCVVLQCSLKTLQCSFCFWLGHGCVTTHGQVVHTVVPLSPSSIICYRSMGNDALQLGS